MAQLADGSFVGRGVPLPGEAGAGAISGVAIRIDSFVIQPDFAVAALMTNPGGSGTFWTLHIVTSEGRALRAGEPVMLGDNARPQLSITDQTVNVEIQSFKAGDSHCCPSWPMTLRFLRVGSELELISASEEPLDRGMWKPPLPEYGRPLPAQGTDALPRPPRTGGAGLLRARPAEQLASALVALALALTVRSSRKLPRNARS